MCIAGLNVSTQPCNHRWIELVRPCNSATNLANCSERLRLEGWETRSQTCPWCDNGDRAVHETTHRLFGSFSPPSSSTPAPTSAELSGAAQTRRRGSVATVGSSLSRHSSSSSLETERGLKHREMNDRLNLYLTASPHEVLPSARKHYPTYSEGVGSPPPTREETLASDGSSVRSASRKFKFTREWERSVRFSKAIFKG